MFKMIISIVTMISLTLNVVVHLRIYCHTSCMSSAQNVHRDIPLLKKLSLTFPGLLAYQDKIP